MVDSNRFDKSRPAKVSKSESPQLNDLIEKISEKAVAIGHRDRANLTDAIELGNLLTRFKVAVGHGNFEEAIDFYQIPVTIRQVQRWMLVYENREDVRECVSINKAIAKIKKGEDAEDSVQNRPRSVLKDDDETPEGDGTSDEIISENKSKKSPVEQKKSNHKPVKAGRPKLSEEQLKERFRGQLPNWQEWKFEAVLEYWKIRQKAEKMDGGYEYKHHK